MSNCSIVEPSDGEIKHHQLQLPIKKDLTRQDGFQFGTNLAEVLASTSFGHAMTQPEKPPAEMYQPGGSTNPPYSLEGSVPQLPLNPPSYDMPPVPQPSHTSPERPCNNYGNYNYEVNTTGYPQPGTHIPSQQHDNSDPYNDM